MQIEVSGCGARKAQMIIRAADFFIHQMVARRKTTNTRLTIQLLRRREMYAKDSLGEATRIIADPGQYIIRLYARMAPAALLSCLAHECVHIKQMLVDGFVVPVADDVIVRFKNHKYDWSTIPYEQQVWEIEANRLEPRLVAKYLRHENS